MSLMKKTEYAILSADEEVIENLREQKSDRPQNFQKWARWNSDEVLDWSIISPGFCPNLLYNLFAESELVKDRLGTGLESRTISVFTDMVGKSSGCCKAAYWWEQ